MASQELTVQKVTQDGLVPSLIAAEDQNVYINNPRTFLVVDNADVAAKTVTINAQISTATIGGLGEVDIDDISVVVGAGAQAYLFAPPQAYSPAGKATANLSDTTSVTIGAFELPRS